MNGRPVNEPVNPGPAVGQPVSVSSATILHVNDDDAARYAVSKILKQGGANVREATTGAEALRLVRELPDLVVLDVHLPDMNGIDVCHRIKSDPATAGIPVLHLSAKLTRPEDRVRGLEGGADGYLVAPVEPPELIATIASLLRMRDAERGRLAAETAAKVNAERVAQLEHELRALERLMVPSGTVATAQIFGAVTIRESHPATFADLASLYQKALRSAVDQREFKVTHPVGEQLDEICDSLGVLKAGPRDVVEIHTHALKQEMSGVHGERARICAEEGRLLILQLMGLLVTHYRPYALGSGVSSARERPARRESETPHA